MSVWSIHIFQKKKELEGFIPIHALVDRPQILSSCPDLRKPLLGLWDWASLTPWSGNIYFFSPQQAQTRDQTFIGDIHRQNIVQ